MLSTCITTASPGRIYAICCRSLDSHREALSSFETYRMLFEHTLLPELHRYRELDAEVTSLPFFPATSWQHIG
jgi:hypothetical protein